MKRDESRSLRVNAQRMRVLAAMLLCLATGAWAQPVLTHSAYKSMLAAGTETYSAFNAEGSRFDTGTPGATDNVFSFEGYAFASEPSAVTEYTRPGAYPFDSLFDGATHVVVQNTGGTFFYYNYMKLTDGAFLYMGDASGDGGALFSSMMYEPPFPLYTFPLRVGDSVSFTCDRTDHLGRPGRLDMAYKVESAGELHARGGSRPVLLIRRVFIYTDSVDATGAPRIERRKWARLELAGTDGAVSYVNVDTSTIEDAEPYVMGVSHIIKREPSPAAVTPARPDDIVIQSVYPLPAVRGNPVTLSWRTFAAASASIDVYDLSGNRVMRIMEERRHAGRHTDVFGTGSLPAGMYFVRLQHGAAILVRPVSVLK